MKNNLHKNFFDRLFSFVICFVVLSNTVIVSGQTRRGRTTVPQKTAKMSEKSTTGVETLVSENSNLATAGAWNSGQLPPPAALPEGNPEQIAAMLAQKILAGNEQSIPALLAALQFAGFFITDKNGQTLIAPPDGKGQGLAINGWEIAAAAKMLGEGKQTSVRDLNERLKSIPYFRGRENVASLMLEDVRANAENNRNQFVRNWARLIIELGKKPANKNNTAQQPEEAEINAVQHLLLMRRLYGDLWARAERWKMQIGVGENEPRNRENYFVKTSFSRSNTGESLSEKLIEQPKFNFQTISEDTPQQKIPCRMDGNAPTVMDAGATVSGETYGTILGLLEELYQDTPTEKAIQKYAMFQAIANTLLAYAKFIQTYAALETKIILEDAPPLIRTKNALPGARKPLRAEVRMNIGNWQMYNCIRLAMNVTTGLDFATVNDGPIGDVGVTWHLDKGGAGDRYSNRTGVSKTEEQIVGFTQDGARIQNAGVGAKQIGDANYTKTDDKGIVRIILEGTPQRNAKIGRVTQVDKQAVIRTTIKMKAGEIKGDMVDVIGQALGGVAGTLTMPAELIYRSDWVSTAVLTVPVIDWEECGGGWSGTVSITRRRADSSEVTNKKGVRTTTDFSRTLYDYNYSATVNIKNAKAFSQSGVSALNKQISAGLIQVNAEAVVNSKTIWGDEKQSFYHDNCGQRMTKRVVYEKNHDEKTGSGQASAEGNIYIDPMQNRFTIQLKIGEIGGKMTRRNIRQPSGYCDAASNKATDTSSEASEEIEWSAINIDDGVLDPNRPDVIEGSKSYTDSSGTEIEIRWSLRHCG